MYQKSIKALVAVAVIAFSGIAIAPASASTPSAASSAATSVVSETDSPAPDKTDRYVLGTNDPYSDPDALNLSGNAQAALYTCNDRYTRIVNGQYARIPFHYNPGTYDCILEQGDSSVAVSDLQDSLNRCHQQGLAVDGAFGPATRQAIVNVQNYYGLYADGVYGPQTRHAMQWWGGSTCNSGAWYGL